MFFVSKISYAYVWDTHEKHLGTLLIRIHVFWIRFVDTHVVFWIIFGYAHIGTKQSLGYACIWIPLDTHAPCDGTID